ncbi:alpha/beta hydrolase family protein [Nocardia sp. bgisy134]|uniref:alpha/beta hydrolase family protein n=1 Tax=Nocardia sp. bgisy134 TaxID=3413789 RepID=UPI003D70B8EF
MAWLHRRGRATGKQPIRRRTIAAVAVLLLAGATWITGPAAAVPAPSGPHPVARTEAALTAGARTIPLSIWYPTTTKPGAAPYIPASSLAAAAQMASKAALWLHTPAAAPAMSATVLPISVDAPVAEGGLLPVVIWSPALGTPRWIASGLLMELASRGYVVVAIDHTGESPAVEVGGRVQVGNPPDAADHAFMQAALDMRIRDTRLVLSQLHTLPVVGARGDLDRMAMAGHSYGGQTAMATMAVEPRIRTSLVLDGPAVWDGVEAAPDTDRPVLLLAMGAMVHASWTATDASIVTLEGAGHYTGTDMPTFGCATDLCGTIDPNRGAAITSAVMAAWLSGHLLGVDAAMPEDPALRWRAG